MAKSSPHRRIVHQMMVKKPGKTIFIPDHKSLDRQKRQADQRANWLKHQLDS